MLTWRRKNTGAIWLSLVLALCSFPSAARAGTIKFAANGDANAGTVKGDAPISALGQLQLKNGILNLNGRVATIKAASELTDSPHVVLVGSVLRCEALPAASGGSKDITGLALFMLGEYIDRVDDKTTPDVIFRNGGQVTGRIVGPEGNELVVKRSNGAEIRVALSEILYIRSPRVFVFKMSAKAAAVPAASGQAIGPQSESDFWGEVLSAQIRPTASQRAITMSSIVPPEQRRQPEEQDISNMSPAQLFEESDVPVMPIMPFVPSKNVNGRIGIPSFME